MKIVITGISGLLGSEIAKLLENKHEIIGITNKTPCASFCSKNLDICDYQSTYDTISKINPDFLIHSAAVSNVDECEKNNEKAYKINSIGTRNLALACQRFDTPMIYISTDYVFSGDKFSENGYTEFDTPQPINVYGQSKLCGEKFVQQILNKFFIVRTSWLYGSSRPNFVSQIAEALLSKNEYSAAIDMISAPTNVYDLALGIEQLIESGKYGIYHITNNGFASRYDIAIQIAKMMNISDFKIKKVKLSALGLPAKRPEFSGLRNYLFEIDNFTPLRAWQESIHEFLVKQNYL